MGTIRLAALALSMVVCLPLTGAGQEAWFQDEIEVRRIITEVRVIDQGGRPVSGLERDDFVVSVGEIPAEVEAVEWVESQHTVPVSTYDPSDRRPQLLAPPAADPRSGRLLVLVFQSDIGLAPVRLKGLFRMSHYARTLMEQLAPEDRVAVAVFCSHLELHCDLTNDYQLISDMLTVPALFESYQSTEQRSSPSLVEHFDVDAAWDAATMSKGLEVIARALEPIPGPKSIVLFGWGIGTYGANGVWLGEDYRDARYALAAARTSVFSLDITTADYHSLEVGLQAMSSGTGGFYMKTHLFPAQAITRLVRVISGYYELSVIAPAESTGFQSVDIEVVNHRHFAVLSRPVIHIGADS